MSATVQRYGQKQNHHPQPHTHQPRSSFVRTPDPCRTTNRQRPYLCVHPSHTHPPNPHATALTRPLIATQPSTTPPLHLYIHPHLHQPNIPPHHRARSLSQPTSPSQLTTHPTRSNPPTYDLLLTTYYLLLTTYHLPLTTDDLLLTIYCLLLTCTTAATTTATTTTATIDAIETAASAAAGIAAALTATPTGIGAEEIAGQPWTHRADDTNSVECAPRARHAVRDVSLARAEIIRARCRPGHAIHVV